MTELKLTNDQENAFNAFVTFLADPVESVFVLEGYSGTGKSTLVGHILDKIPNLLKATKLINPDTPEYELALTATTNKAAENLSNITGFGVSTIHSYLCLTVRTDYKTGKTTLVPRSNEVKGNVILFIDEASYIDSQLLGLIFKMTQKCKIVFMGDPAQLTPVQSSGTPPVFKAKFNGAKLKQVVRQAEGNPIQDVSTKFRETVGTGEFFSFKPDGHHIQYMNRLDFNQAILNEFSRPDWRHNHSKVLGWTNKCVIGYNNLIANSVKGNPEFQVNDYAVCNKRVVGKNYSLKTDQMVRITQISGPTEVYGAKGRHITLDSTITAFCPESLDERKLAIARAKAAGDDRILATIDEKWVDLRAAYSCTINKSQGSTYDRVFIDLDDIKRCNSGDQMARMLYVGVSRAREQVFLTGDIF